MSTQSAFATLMDSCRSLQSLITAPAPVPVDSQRQPSPETLLTPPLTHAPPPLKLRLRSSRRQTSARPESLAPAPCVKKSTRQAGKKRRLNDDLRRKSQAEDSDMQDTDSEAESQQPANAEPVAPATPKRARIAPERLPLGLERGDFHKLHEVERQSERNGEEGDVSQQDDDEDATADSDDWSTEDDRILIELILEKLKLSKAEWQDCARHLGRDRNAVNRRWKSLMVNGDVGLKAHPARRTRLHSTWR